MGSQRSCRNALVTWSELKNKPSCRFLDMYEWFSCCSCDTSKHGVAVVNTRHYYCKHKSHYDIIIFIQHDGETGVDGEDDRSS